MIEIKSNSLNNTTTQVKLLEQDLLLVIINDHAAHWALLVYACTCTWIHSTCILYTHIHHNATLLINRVLRSILAQQSLLGENESI